MSDRLDLAKPIGECSTQELVEALMLHRGDYNLFDAEQVLADLYSNRDLWVSFFMGPLIVEHEDYCLNGLFLILRDILHQWHGDTLYVHCRQDECVFSLLVLGKAWKCDDVQVFNRERTGHLMGWHPAPPPVIAYRWD